MPSTRIFLSALVAILALLPSPVLGQARTVDVRASVGYAYPYWTTRLPMPGSEAEP